MSIIYFSGFRVVRRTVVLARKTFNSRRFVIPFCSFLLLCGLTQQVRADFVGYYSLSNFTLTNTDNGGYPSSTNGTAITPDNGQSVVITGGNSGTGLYGATDLFIAAESSGTIQFDWTYSSNDPSSSGEFPFGCGVGFTGPCDDAGYLLGGSVVNGVLTGATFVELADDINQGSGPQLVTLTVTAGELFGFEVETMDNLGGPGVLTVTDFDPVPEPRLAGLLIALLGLAAAAYAKSPRSIKRKQEAA